MGHRRFRPSIVVHCMLKSTAQTIFLAHREQTFYHLAGRQFSASRVMSAIEITILGANLQVQHFALFGASPVLPPRQACLVAKCCFPRNTHHFLIFLLCWCALFRSAATSFVTAPKPPSRGQQEYTPRVSVLFVFSCFSLEVLSCLHCGRYVGIIPVLF